MPTTTIPLAEADSATAAPRTLYFALAFYFLIVVCAFPFFRYVLGPDQISYISIAQHYASGEWAEAINMYWSPLISWLIVPFLLAGISGMAAIKIISILAGAAALAATWKLAGGFELSAEVETISLCTAALMLAAYVFISPGPDVIVVAIALVYFCIIFDRDYEYSRKAGALCGVLGSIGFFTKAYLFWFFLAHFTVITALRALRGSNPIRARLLRHFITGLIVFFAISAPWLIAMRAKTGAFTLGTAAAWNHRLVGPQSPGFPQYYRLIPPPDPHALSMWESPSPNLLPDWHPLGSLRDLKYELRVIGSNLKWLRTFLLETSLFSFAAIFAYLIWGIAFGSAARYWWALVFATFVILPAGYVLVTIEERYLWPELLLLLLAGAVVIDVATKTRIPVARNIAIATYALSFAFFPLRQMASLRNSDRSIFMASNALRGVIPAHNNLAACGSWNDSLKLAYYLNLSFYGSTGSTPDEEAVRNELLPNASKEAPPAPLSPSQIARSLQEDHIAYYLVWPACKTLPPSQLLTAPIDVPDEPGAKIFRVRDTNLNQ